jgi:hypothetical protein
MRVRARATFLVIWSKLRTRIGGLRGGRADQRIAYFVEAEELKRRSVPQGRNGSSPVRSAGTKQKCGSVPQARSNGRGLGLLCATRKRDQGSLGVRRI